MAGGTEPNLPRASCAGRAGARFLWKCADKYAIIDPEAGSGKG